MTTSERDGGPAFPPVHDPATHPSGMSLRDYFAANALSAVAPLLHQPRSESAQAYRARIAVEVYAIADAMLAERSKK